MGSGSIQRVAIGVIPARWGSTRFPGKPLAVIGGKPLIQWVAERSRLSRKLSEVLVATDDERIRQTVESLGIRCMMTRSDHSSGTDRVAEAVRNMRAEVIVNIQGDEPMIDPRLIDEVATTLLSDSAWDMATAACPIRTADELKLPSIVKVVVDNSGKALYFSRAPVPFVRDGALEPVAGLHWRHIGLYGYQRVFLERLMQEPPCAMEQVEKLEQLRALHIGGRIKVIFTEYSDLGVDVPEDVARVETAMRALGWI